jgi:deoxyribonuclease IV
VPGSRQRTATAVGAHVPTRDPGGQAELRGAACAQVFLSSPQQWAGPRLRGDEAQLRQLSTGPLPLVVHAPYLVNLASPSPKVRTASVQLLQATLDAATAIGAHGVVVHAGQAGAHSSFDEGLSRWLDAAATVGSDTPVWIENLASGSSAMGRYIDDWVTLVHAAQSLGAFPVGVCLDTCHAWAAGEVDDVGSATRYVTELRDRVGAVDLVHCNGSRDHAGAGRDRHANLADSAAPEAVLAALCVGAQAPLVVVETPGGPDAHAADIARVCAWFA